jgi:hypothetical protein
MYFINNFMKKILIIALCFMALTKAISQCSNTSSITISPTSTGANISWAAVSGAVQYSARIFSHPANVDMGVFTVQSGTSWSFVGLTSGTQYRFQIATICASSVSTGTSSIFTTTSGQIVYTPMTAAGYSFKYLKADSLFHLSVGDTTLKRADTRAGAIVYKNSDSLFYGYDGLRWKSLGGNITNLTNQINNKVDTIFYNTDTFFYRKNNVTYGIVLNLVPNIRAIVAGYGLAGGGDLSADRSFIVDTTVIASKPYVDAGLATKQNTLTNPITGTGLSGRVPFYTGTTTLSSDTGLVWDSNNTRLLLNGALTVGGSAARPSIATRTNAPLDFITNNILRGSISSNGAFGWGIGTASPNANFHIGQLTGDLGVRIGANVGGTRVYIGQDGLKSFAEMYFGNDWLIGGWPVSDFRISRLGNNYFNINSTTGNVGLKTITDAGFTFDVNGTTRLQGKLSQPTTANSPKGTATLVNGVVTISNTLATTGCFIQVNYRTGTALSGTSSILTVSSIVAATSFTVTAYTPGAATTNTSDNNVIEYTISN